MKKHDTKLTFRPRDEGAEDSVVSVITVERIAPTPIPATKRKMQNMSKFGAMVATVPAIEFNVSPVIRVGRLPMWSLNAPVFRR